MNFFSNKLHGLALCFAIAVPAAYLGKLFPIIAVSYTHLTLPTTPYV